MPACDIWEEQVIFSEGEQVRPRRLSFKSSTWIGSHEFSLPVSWHLDLCRNLVLFDLYNPTHYTHNLIHI
jgi:hypothetical protein